MTPDAPPTHSRTAVFSAAGTPLELRSAPLPRLAEGELLVRVTCCTLCGSDLHSFQGRRSVPVPTILGHEILGEVAALGPGPALLDENGREVRRGDRVTWSVAASCGSCFFCEHGLPQKCEELFKYGHEELTPRHPLSGGLAEHCHLVAGSALVVLPAGIPDLVACPANCATATVAAALRVGGDCEDKLVLVQGAGMLGLTACAMAHAGGARHVIASDIAPARLELARRFGADECIDVSSTTEELERHVRSVSAGRGVDLAVELSGALGAMQCGLELLRVGGCYVLVGAVFDLPDLALSASDLVRRHLSLHGVHNYTPADLVQAVAFLEHHHTSFPFADLVAASYPLEQVQEAFDHAVRSRALRVAVQS